MHNFLKKFSERRSTVVDEERSRGPVAETVRKVEEIVKADRRAIIDSIVTATWTEL